MRSTTGRSEAIYLSHPIEQEACNLETEQGKCTDTHADTNIDTDTNNNTDTDTNIDTKTNSLAAMYHHLI